MRVAFGLVARFDGGSLIARRAITVCFAVIAFASAPAASVAAAADGGCKLVKIAEWPVRPGRVHVVVDGAINGQPVGVMLDTGAMRTVVARSTAVRLGLARTNVQGERMTGIGGETLLETAPIDRFQVGDAVRRNWRMLIAGERPMGDIGVVLGADFFQNVDVEFDLAHDAVRLFQPKDCGNTALAYWATEGTSRVAIDPFNSARPEFSLPVKVNGRSMRATLDSGAFRTLLTEAAAASVGVTPGSPGVVASCLGGVGRNPVDAWTGPFESFGIGDEIVRDPRLQFADMWKYRPYTFEWGLPEMLLGADFLRSHRVLVSTSQRRMYFSYSGGTVFPFPSQSVKCSDLRRQADEAKTPVGEK